MTTEFDNGLGELEFKEIDFDGINVGSEVVHKANAILRAKLAGAKKVYGTEIHHKNEVCGKSCPSVEISWTEKRFGTDIVEATIINIHPLNTKESKA